MLLPWRTPLRRLISVSVRTFSVDTQQKYTKRQMKVFAQVVGLDTGDSAPAVMITTDSSRYMVNAGEGLQRFCAEHRVRLMKLDGIFLTEISQQTVGGLPGMILTMADMGRKQMRLFGGTGLIDYMFATRHFMRRSDVVLEAREFSVESNGAHGGRLPPVTFTDMAVQPIVVDSSDRAIDDADSTVEEAIRHLLTTDGAFAPFQGAAPVDVLTGQSPHLADGETPTARYYPDKAPGAPAPSSRAAKDAAQRESMVGLPLPVPFNPMLVSQQRPAEGQAEGSAASANSEGQTVHHADALPAILRIAHDPAAASKPRASRGRRAVSYIFCTPPVSGRFLPDKARALGLKPGPEFGKLSRGQDVTIQVPDEAGGTKCVTIRPNDVKDPDLPGQLLAVASCPSPDFVDALTAAPEWQPYYRMDAARADLGPVTRISVIYHMCDPSVAAMPAYLRWLARFGPATRHVMLHPLAAKAAAGAIATHLATDGVSVCLHDDVSSPVAGHSNASVLFAAQAQQACRMHLLEPTLFPLLDGVPRGIDSTAGLSNGLVPSATGLSELQGHARAILEDEPRLQSVLEVARARQTQLDDPARPGPHSSKAHDPTKRPLAPADGAIHIEAAQALSAHHLLPLSQSGPDGSAAIPSWTVEDAIAPTLADPAVRPALDAALGRRTAFNAACCGAGGHAEAGHSHRSDAQATSAAVATALDALEPPAPHPDSKLIFTGTASAIPSKHRNVSGMFLELPARAAASDGLRSSTSTAPAASVAAGSTDEQAPAFLSGGGHCAVPATVAIQDDMPDRRYAAILDCGEGTYGQLARLMGSSSSSSAAVDAHASSASTGNGPAGANTATPAIGTDVGSALARVRLIWVSHMHADHHLGALRLIGERRAARERLGLPSIPVLVVGPTKLMMWLLEAARVDAALRGPGTWVFADAERFVHRPQKGFHVDLEIEPLPSGMCPMSTEDDLAIAEGGVDVDDDVADGELPAEAPAAGAAVEVDGDDSGAPSAKRHRADYGDGAAASGKTQVWTAASTAAAAPVGPVVVLPPAVVPWGEDPPLGQQPDGPNTRYLATPSMVESTLACMGISALRTIHVKHCYKAYGLRMEVISAPATQAATQATEGGSGRAVGAEAQGHAGAGQQQQYLSSTSASPWPWSVLYSGDTRPCKELVALGVGARVLRFRGPPRRGAGKGNGQASGPDSEIADGAVASVSAPVPNDDPETEQPGSGTWEDWGMALWAKQAQAESTAAATATGQRSATGSTSAVAEAIATASKRSCGLLIHEATFDDTAEGRSKALDKRHSTVDEAVAVGTAAGAEHIILTHFSARYPKLPVLKTGTTVGSGPPAAAAGAAVPAAPAGPQHWMPPGQDQEDVSMSDDSDSTASTPVAAVAASAVSSGRVAVAYDLCTVRGRDLPRLHAMLPALHALFAETDEDEDGASQ